MSSSPRVRLLILHRGGDQIRGSEDVLLNFLERFDRTRLEPFVIFTHPVLGPALEKLGVKGRCLPFPEFYVTRDVRLKIGAPVRDYVATLQQILGIARDNGGFGAILCSGGGPCQLGVPLGVMLKAPVICLQHHPAPKNLLYLWLVPFVGTVVYSSHHTARETQARINKPGEVVHIGIDVRRFVPPESRDSSLRQSLGIPDDAVVFAQIGALVPHKGHRTLLNAFAQVLRNQPHARLMIIGSGPTRSDLEALSAALGLDDAVHFVGRVPDVLSYLQHVLDVHVLASSDEGLGLVSLEAAACGLPTIGTDGTGIREAVIDGETGLLFPTENVDALAAAMIRLARDPSLRSRLGARGRRFVEEEFSVDHYCERVQEIVLERARGHRVTSHTAGH